jgi:serine/threonine protein kinase
VRWFVVLWWPSSHALASWWFQPTQALQDIHQRGIVHRDISPNNVLFTTTPPGDDSGVGSTVVLDFGLALQGRRLGTTWYSSAVGVGTRCFIAPEMRRTLALCSHKVDVWSAGVLIAFQVTRTDPSSSP